MFWGSLHRMILLELLKVFSLALIVLTGLILLAGVISEAMKNGFGPTQILAMIPLLFPGMLPYTVPTTTLFATCLVYGRMSADNEITALKSAGVHMVQVIWPAVVLGLAASAVTMCLLLDTIPYSSSILKGSFLYDIEELLYAKLRRDGCIRHAKMNYEINVKSIHGRTLQTVIVKRRAADGNGFDTFVFAKEAELHVDLAGKRIVLDMRQCQFVQHDVNVGYLGDVSWPIEIPGALMANATKLRASDMTWSELFLYESQLLDEMQKLSKDIDAHQVEIDGGRASDHYRKHVRDQINERMIRDKLIGAIHCEWHLRPAFALGCICFALVGCPVGMWFSKSDYLSAFMLCFLPIVTMYYPLMFCMINLAHAGKLPPWLGMYNADVLMLTIGGMLSWRLARV